jgi:Cys-tRNA(Pro)/Cys-tRNA(Cys) deacylase
VTAGVAYELHSYRHDPEETSFGEEAALALHVEPMRVYKTLIVDVGTRLACGVVPVAQQLDMRALASVLGAKNAQLAERNIAERSTGYVIGGVSPIGQKRRIATVIDTSSQDWPTIYVSAGRRGLELELAPADLAALTNASFALICRQ